MLDPVLLSLLREPGTGVALIPSPVPGTVVAAGTARTYRVEGHAVDLMEFEMISEAGAGHSAADIPPSAEVTTPADSSGHDAAPELRDYHERIFSDGARREALYDNLFELPKLTQSAHFRRMELLDGLSIPDLAEASVVDFGSGPWGFAAVFPRLRAAAVQITIDISFEAIRQAQAKETGAETSVVRRLFITSDGDAIGLADECVDLVWAGEVIEHVRYPALLLQEIARILKPGGMLVLSTPNRDAPLYVARGLQNTVGPEHIALLNATELRDLASECFDVGCLLGYESSICHEVDNFLQDEWQLRAIQERAKHYPELSSGMVLVATVRKDLLESARRRFTRIETLWNQCPATEGAVAPVPLFGDVTGGLLEDRATIAFTVRANKLILLFWSHDWSGEARIEVDGQETRIDLYSHAGGFRRAEWELDGDEPRRIVISRIGVKRPQSLDTQVIFYKAISYIGQATRGPR